MVFGSGELTACKPISDADVGRYLSLCLTNPKLQNQLLPIGGPGPAITPLEQGRMLFDAVGLEPKFKHVPVAVLSGIIAALAVLGKFIPALKHKAEFAKIGRYYGTESMLAWDGTAYDPHATPEFGSDTLAAHYAALARGDLRDDRGDHAVF